MKTTFNKKHLSLAVACALALSFAAGAARAQQATPADTSRATESNRAVWTTSGQQVWMNGFGECWHNGFGPAPLPGTVCGPAMAVPVAQYVAPAPAPYVAPYVAPVVVAAAPVQAVYERYTLDANVLFDFDKSVLSPKGRDVLDGFVTKVKGVEQSTVTAIGHADRFGSDNYNQSLSESRVATVKAYLISRGIESTWVDSSGKGEMQPVTSAGSCAGSATASNIACLQPDRHVTIEMSGTRRTQ
jgi:OOP family OmpA-OmpF porin